MSKNGMFGASGSGDTSGFGGLVNTTTVIGSTQRPFGGYFDQVAVVPDQSLTSKSFPRDSPGNPASVFTPTPNFVK